MCKLRQITHKLNKAFQLEGFIQFVNDLPEFTYR